MLLVLNVSLDSNCCSNYVVLNTLNKYPPLKSTFLVNVYFYPFIIEIGKNAQILITIRTLPWRVVFGYKGKVILRVATNKV